MMKTVKLNAEWKGAMQVDVATRGQTIVIDQAEGAGGKDAGANPLEVFLAALGGCMGTVAAIIAKQERIELRGFSVEIEGDIDTDFLMGKTKEGQAGFTEIRVLAKIDADLTDEEKVEFFEKVDSRCPISDNMINQTKLVFDVK
jgi:putative redox protein